MDIHNPPINQPPRIDPREREFVLKFIDDYCIKFHNSILIKQIQSINFDKPSSLDLKIWQIVKENIAKYVKFHETYPFPIAPAELLGGDYTLAFQKANGTRIRASKELLARHILITSASGGGKTTFTHHLIAQILASGVKAFIIDPKDDSKYLAIRDPECLILHSAAPFNLMQVPNYQTKEEYIATFINCFTKAYYSAELAKQILNEGLQLVLSETNNPSLAALHSAVLSMYSKTDTYSRRDAITGVALRLQRINYHYPGLFNTTQSISFDELFKHSIYLPVTIMDESAEFLISYISHQLYLHNRAKNIRNGLSNIIFLDEGMLSYNKNNTSITGESQLNYLQSLVREFAIAMAVTTTAITQTSPLLRANASLQVCMTLTNSRETEEICKTFNLTKE